MFCNEFKEFFFLKCINSTRRNNKVNTNSMYLSKNHRVRKIRFVEGIRGIHLGVERKRDFDGLRPRQRGIVFGDRLAVGIGVGHVHLKAR